MTAEILVMNRIAVAMAADSLVSIERSQPSPGGAPGTRTTKSYERARKLAQLNGRDPVGVMVYDSPHFHGLPWEVILAEFARTQPGAHEGVADYATAFFSFLTQRSEEWVSAARMRAGIEDAVRRTTEMLHERWNRALEELDNSPAKYRAAARQCVREVSSERMEQLRAYPEISLDDAALGRSDATLRELFSKELDGLWSNLDSGYRGRLIALGREEIRRIKATEPDRTGIVFAGFGEAELFPAAHVYVVSGRVEGGVRCALRISRKLGPDQPGVILPAAQTTMVKAFMEGVNKRIRARVDEMLAELCRALPSGGDELLQAMKKMLADEINRNVKPIMDGVTFLPAGELAMLARGLVAFTALHNRVSIEPETVGGPYEVALISRGEGFVWFERADDSRRGTRPVEWESL